MKNKIWLFVFITAMIILACDDKNNGDNNNGDDIITPSPPPEPHGAPFDHLGIGEVKGETCSDDCTLQDYRTTEQKISFPENAIYRYGKEVNYTAQELSQAAAANYVIDMFIGKDGLNEVTGGGDAYKNIMDKIEVICFIPAVDLNVKMGYNWNNATGTLGIASNATKSYIVGNRLPRLIQPAGLPAGDSIDYIIVQ